MNIDKISSAIDVLMDKVNETALSSPSRLSPNDLHYHELGKIAYALEILPMVGLLKKYIREDQNFEELQRRYHTANGTLLEEYIRGDGVSTRTVVILDGVEQSITFKNLLEKLTKNDA